MIIQIISHKDSIFGIDSYGILYRLRESRVMYQHDYQAMGLVRGAWEKVIESPEKDA